MSGNTKASLSQGGQKGARMSRRVLQVKRVDLERKDLARKAPSEAGAEILLQNQGMETQGEKVEDENSRLQVQTVHRDWTAGKSH